MNDSIIWTCIVFPINIFFEHSCFLAEQFLRKIFSTNASVFKIIHVLWPCYPLIIIFTLVCWVLVYHYLNTTFSFCECIVSALSECPHYANRLPGNVPSLSLWLTNFRRIYVYYLLQCLYLWEIWTVESSFSIINIPHMYRMVCYSYFVSVQFLFLFFCSCIIWYPLLHFVLWSG